MGKPRVWICDGCGKRGVWSAKDGWRYLDGVPGVSNNTDGLIAPLVICSEVCFAEACRKARVAPDPLARKGGG